ncbi:hypothetical protein SAMN05444365_10221 [Micromonospora pattaloongensis]|uniref:Peptidase M23 n=1 Tax=Micromonospora pattaloongensis TaxID=405436 RepID=A0A1H3J9X7_9ACTN|nr:hypothetical protein [Micromonospora pattaloongensis]SDY36830.1 hypothetical protein SAMN05444365_10221 [Micromonospora pattaloongensis]
MQEIGDKLDQLRGKAGRGRLLIATGVIAAMGFGAYVGGPGLDAPADGGGATTVAQAELGRDRSEQAANRSFDRQPVGEQEQKAPARKPQPTAGYGEVEMENATAIVEAGQEMGVPKRGLVIAVATAMQESNLLNRASEVLPESKNYKHQGTGWDHDSVGLFQQRTSTGWGAVKDLMDPKYSAQAFYKVLITVPGWDQMALTDAAQRVQVSGFPFHYAKHEGNAEAVVNEILSAQNSAH